MASRIIANNADIDALHPGAKMLLQGLVDKSGLSEIKINSGHRTEAGNAAVGGAKHSQHLDGRAIDLDISGLDDAQKRQLLEAAIDSGARGVGIYPSGNSMHLDTRQSPALWGLTPGAPYAAMSHENAPGWAKDPLKRLFGTTGGAGSSMQGYIDEAASKFGVSPTVMYAIARRESSFNPDAKNPNSSASGLFQFVDKTWTDAKAIYGQKLGMPDTATPFDPKWSSIMAAAVMKENSLVIKQMTGRDAKDGELYIAHFLGGQKAVTMIQASEKTPEVAAALLFPAEAAANPKQFYDKDGMPKSVGTVYTELSKIDGSIPPTDVAGGETKPKPKADDEEAKKENLPTWQNVAAAGPVAVKTGGPSGAQSSSELESFAQRVGASRQSRGLMG